MDGWTYQTYAGAGFALSIFVVLCAIFMDFFLNEMTLVVHIYHCMSLRSRWLYCWDVVVSGNREGSRVCACFLWIVRIVILVCSAYLWSTCILQYQSFHVKPTWAYPHMKIYEACVYQNADCFAGAKSYLFYSFWNDFLNVCTTYHNEIALHPKTGLLLPPELFQTLTTDYPFVMCIAVVPPSTITYTREIAVAFALGLLILLFFELLVGVLYKAHYALVSTLAVVLAGILWLAVWVAGMFLPSFFALNTSWLGSLMLLAVTLILWISALAAYYLRAVQYKKWETWKGACIERASDTLNLAANCAPRDNEKEDTAMGSKQLDGTPRRRVTATEFESECVHSAPRPLSSADACATKVE
eukprot:GHVT01000612.1.p1 GENE.GHVT01000612.1~~GHVT01000612.1.p1  ORF type:complete len:357 (+),score=21.44 GHVT01000612.1:804-1874(+)